MIAASEPLEFIPHGRRVLNRHPGELVNGGANPRVPETSLLYQLTNFAIRDDHKLNLKSEKEKEWWVVREVYAKDGQNATSEEESQAKLNRQRVDDDVTQSFTALMKMKTEFNITIKSEMFSSSAKRNESNQPGSSRIGSTNTSSNMSKKFNLNDGKGSDAKRGESRNHRTDCCYEEELYVRGHTAVWSKGLISTPATRLTDAESRETISCFTCESPIVQALFCNFYESIDNTILLDSLNKQIGEQKSNINLTDPPDPNLCKVLSSICLIDNTCMRVFTSDGHDFVSSMHFQVQKAWAMKYGLLLEKEASSFVHNSLLPQSFLKPFDGNNSYPHKKFARYDPALNFSTRLGSDSMTGLDQVQLPTCFSITHPLDEMNPVLMKTQHNGLQYYKDGNTKIVFVSSKPSICLTYDSKTSLHSLWIVRKATQVECVSASTNFNSTTSLLNQSGGNFGASISGVSNLGQKGHTSQSGLPKNLASSFLAGISSPFTVKPANYEQTPTRSRLNSPMEKAFSQQGMSPHSSFGHASNVSVMSNMCQTAPPPLPLYPDICFEHIWTENQGNPRDMGNHISAAFKCFLHIDHTGQEYLCYLVHGVTGPMLNSIRLQNSNSQGNANKSRLIVGVVSTTKARDAVSLDHLKMLAVIDESGNIILYSGICIIGKVHIGGVLAGLVSSPYNKSSVFHSPFPRRSSLLPSRMTETPVFDDSALHMLSPVPHSSSADNRNHGPLVLLGLRDPVANRLTLEYEKGLFYRISLPELTSCALVERCLTALKATLQKDIVMQIIVKWYGTRNAPGTQDLCPEQEWLMFAYLLFSLIGYDTEKLEFNRQTDVTQEQPEVAMKKQRTSSDGSHDDWEYLMNSKLHLSIGNSLASLLNLQNCKPLKQKFKHKTDVRNYVYKNKGNVSGDLKTASDVQFNTSALLFPYVLQVLFNFHLIYEETKLNTLYFEDLKLLAQFLYQLSKDLGLNNYVGHYWKDFPLDCGLYCGNNNSQISPDDLKFIIQPSYFKHDAPSIFGHINGLLRRDRSFGSYPCVVDINRTSKDLVEVIGYIVDGCPGNIQQILPSRSDGINASSTPRPRENQVDTSNVLIEQNTVLMLCDRGITLKEIEFLPPAISLLLLNTISRCKDNPPVGWPTAAYSLIMREDLARQASIAAKQDIEAEDVDTIAFDSPHKETAYTHLEEPEPDQVPKKCDDEPESRTGMEHLDTRIFRLLYPQDHRVAEVCNLLQSSKPVLINLVQRPEVSDHDFIEEQEKHLYALSARTMALPIARGMLTLRSSPCIATEPLNVPKLCVSGQGPPPRSNTIELPHSTDSPPQCIIWPTFHNGVAAGLSLVPMGNGKIDSTWIIYNKPKGTTDMSTEHAGFLMALGLNGHLKDMAFLSIYDYLVKCQEMTSLGLLLGIAATYRGTMNVSATKLMSIHLEAFLPPTSIELDIAQNTQVAALLGIGLIYQGTMHTHIAEVLLNEIGRPPGPEMENSMEREGYALAAGLGLGFVCLGAHASAPQHLAGALRHYMLGGNKRPLTGAQKEKYKQPSFQIREGSTVNLDVTSPGATLALGLLYLRSGNRAVAEWLAPPQTHYLLDYVRPDLLMLRVVARGLILWNDIEPFDNWVQDQVPETIKPYVFAKPTEDHIDYEAMCQAYCNIVAGACFCIGLRYAGSANEDARDTLMEYVAQFISLGSKSIGELAGKSTIETCLNVILLSAGMVMSGTGDISVLRACRRLRARCVPTPGQSAERGAALCHGSHAAVHCAAGLLFLGAGRCCLSTSREAVAALVAAFFPKFPTHSNDNRYHLQAFRHLYVLATEPRLLIPRDISTGKLCYVNIQVVTLDHNQVMEMRAPCILPELNRLKEVRINDSRYWPIVFQKDRNWEQLKLFLNNSWCFDIKQKAGCLSYLEDPHGFQTLLAQMLTLEKSNIWSATPENILSFSSDKAIVNFTKHYLVNMEKFLGNEDANESRYPGLNKETSAEENVICPDCYFFPLIKPKGEERTRTRSKSSKSSSKTPVRNLKCQCVKNTKDERELVQMLRMATYECVIKDKLCILPMWITFIKIMKKMRMNPTSYNMWQMKLLMSQIDNHNQRYTTTRTEGEAQKIDVEPLLSLEFAISIKQRVSNETDSWELSLVPHLRKYIGLEDDSELETNELIIKRLSAFVTYYDIPKDIVQSEEGVNNLNLLQCLLQLDKYNLDVNTVSKICRCIS